MRRAGSLSYPVVARRLFLCNSCTTLCRYVRFKDSNLICFGDFFFFELQIMIAISEGSCTKRFIASGMVRAKQN